MSRAAEGRPTRIAGLRASALAEIVTALAVLLAIDLALLGATRFAGAPFHPFWVVVLFAAAQYGSAEGLAAALMSAAALLVGAMPERGFGEDFYAFLSRVLFLPTLWAATGLAIGLLRDRHRLSQEETQRALAEAHAREDRLSAAARRLSDANRALEEQVAGQLRTVIGLYTAARAMERNAPAEVVLGIADVVRAAIGAQALSIWLVRGEALEKVHDEGWGTHAHYARLIGPGHRLHDAVLRRRQTVTASDAAGEAALAGEGVLAGPIVDSETGELIGMIKVERIGFLDLTLTTVENFRAVCAWVGTAYVRARAFAAAEADRVTDASRTLLSRRALDQVRPLLIGLGRRFGFAVSLIMVRARRRGGAAPDIGAELADAQRVALRGTDLAFALDHAGDYAVLLAGAGEKQAAIAAQKFRATLQARLAARDPAIEAAIAVETLVDMRAGSPVP